ncbi:helix-turn-helix domain-containing protein [Nocardia brasiliensis]
MTTVVDTGHFDPRDRREVMQEAIRASFTEVHVECPPQDLPGRFRLDLFQFGQLALFRAQGSGCRIVRTTSMIRRSSAPMLLLDVMHDSASHVEQTGTRFQVGADSMFTVDVDLPFSIGWSGGTASALGVPVESLGLRAETIRSALGVPGPSPLYYLAAQHIAVVSAAAEELHDPVDIAAVSASLVEMVRALVLSAAGRRDTAALPQQILLARIGEYVRRRLADPQLCPESIARAHGISVRYLFKLHAAAGMSLEQSIITQRLERARAELACRASRHRSITAIAAAQGFRSTSHFGRRFRAAYGMSPSQWRRTALE